MNAAMKSYLNPNDRFAARMKRALSEKEEYQNSQKEGDVDIETKEVD